MADSVEIVKIIEDSLSKLSMVEACTFDKVHNNVLIKLCDASNQEEVVKERLKYCEHIYQSTYKDGLLQVEEEAPNLFTGWNSTFTGQPIPEIQMKEWISTIVDKILPYQPQRILELGSGSGLIVERLASQDFCTYYLASDLSSNSIQFLKSRLGEFGNWGSKLEFEEGDANKILDIVIESNKQFDMVILNSVILHFPNSQYLTTVLEKSVQILNPGGGIFVGDIRNVDWLEMYMTKMEIQNLKNKRLVRWKEFWSGVEERLEKNIELCVGPKYFQDFIERNTGLSFGTVDLHRGNNFNEMVYYRYNVVLSKLQVPDSMSETRILWNKEMDLTEVLKTMENIETIIIEDIPNQRLYVESRLVRDKFSNNDVAFDMEKLVEELTFQAKTESENPEAIAKIGEELGYNVKLSISENNPVNFNVELYKSNIPIPKLYNFNGNEAFPFKLSNNPSHNKERNVARTIIKIKLSKVLKGSAFPSPQIRFI